jgi:hypothetical protein
MLPTKFLLNLYFSISYFYHSIDVVNVTFYGKFAKFSLKRRLVKVLLAVGVVFIKNRMAVQLY